MKAFAALLKNHWFVPCALILAALAASASSAFADPLGAGAVIGALVLGLPLAYALCYRSGSSSMPILPCAMLALLGVWAVDWLRPPPRPDWLGTFLMIQHAKWPLILYFEVKFASVLWRLVRKEGKSVGDACAAAAEEQNLPAWLGRLARWEATQWQKLRICLAHRKR